MSEIKLVFYLPTGSSVGLRGVKQDNSLLDTHRRTHRVASLLFIWHFADNAVISFVTFFWGTDWWLMGI